MPRALLISPGSSPFAARVWRTSLAGRPGTLRYHVRWARSPWGLNCSAYEVLEALCGCACTSTWTVAALARCHARTPHASPPRRRACCDHISRFIFLSRFHISRFSLQFEVYLVGGWVISQFCVLDHKEKWEFINTIPDSSFTLRALACVERAR